MKGALLFKVWDIADPRATLDIDTLAKTSNSLESIIFIIKELCEKSASIQDGIIFSSTSISGEVMQLQREYEGVRVWFQSLIGSARIPMQIDIGFGDVVTPSLHDIEYPTLLDFPAPKLKAYPPQTVIAEKIHTMVEKGGSNSRIKDYYDVWLLFRQAGLSLPGLRLALLRTFKRRGMDFDFSLTISVIKQYANSSQAQVLWEQFKRKELPQVHHHGSFQDLAGELLDSLIKKLEEKELLIQ